MLGIWSLWPDHSPVARKALDTEREKTDLIYELLTAIQSPVRKCGGPDHHLRAISTGPGLPFQKLDAILESSHSHSSPQ
jgi:hypothetical protein